MDLAERIEVRLIGGIGVAFPNLDATRRLREMGFRRRTGRGTRRSTRNKVQADFLAGYIGIRDVAHYRQLVEDERSEGPMVWFNPGTKLLMERTEHPKSKRVWYLVLDTAIGAQPDFLEELQRAKSITITSIESSSCVTERQG